MATKCSLVGRLAAGQGNGSLPTIYRTQGTAHVSLPKWINPLLPNLGLLLIYMFKKKWIINQEEDYPIKANSATEDLLFSDTNDGILK